MVVTSHLPEAAFILGPHPAAVEQWARVHDPEATEDLLGAIDTSLVTYREQESSRSPEGPVGDPSRVDRFPCLQIDVDITSRSLKFWEGDMWKRRGASRATGPVRLETQTMNAVERRALDVVRRAVALDAIPAELDP